MELDGEPLVWRAARCALDAGLSPVVVVLGFEAERVAAAVSGLQVETVVNPRYPEGMHQSVRAGLDHLGERCAAALILLADMPLVTAAMLRRIGARFRAGAPIVTSRYGGVQAPPTLYAREYFPALRSGGAGGGRRVVGENVRLGAALDWPLQLLADVDRPEDLARIRDCLQQLSSE